MNFSALPWTFQRKHQLRSASQIPHHPDAKGRANQHRMLPEIIFSYCTLLHLQIKVTEYITVKQLKTAVRYFFQNFVTTNKIIQLFQSSKEKKMNIWSLALTKGLQCWNFKFHDVIIISKPRILNISQLGDLKILQGNIHTYIYFLFQNWVTANKVIQSSSCITGHLLRTK